jgi:hypothetical protein
MRALHSAKAVLAAHFKNLIFTRGHSALWCRKSIYNQKIDLSKVQQRALHEFNPCLRNRPVE